MARAIIITWVVFQSIFLGVVDAQVIWQGQTQDVDSLVPKALGYLREGNTEESIMLSRTVLSQYPGYTDFTYILGLSYQKMGRPDWAIPYMEKVIAQDAGYKDAYLSLFTLYQATGNYARINELWKVALNRFHQDKEIQHSYEEFLTKEKKRVAAIRTEGWYIAAKAAVDREDWQKVLAYSDSIAGQDTSDMRPLYLKANAFVHNKDYDKAKDTYEKIKGRGDTSLFVIEQLANIAAAQNDYVRALTYANELQAAAPDTYRFDRMAKVFQENLPYRFYMGANHMQSAQDQPHGHFFISGIEYGHRIGAKDVLVGQFNYGNRRGEKAYQLGLDAWLNYSDRMYAYHHIAWADGTVFPAWRAAYSLYREAGSWLFDIGGRYVRSSDRQDNYGVVASTGRYLGATFIYLRGFLLRDEFRWNQAYSLALRHYYNEEKPDSYVTIIGNIGTSPDDPARYQALNNRFGFLSRSVNAGWQHRLSSWGFTIMGGWSYYKVTETRFINQYDLNLSLRKYF